MSSTDVSNELQRGRIFGVRPRNDSVGPNFGSLDIDVTVNDPKVLTQPWAVELHMKPQVDTEMIDFICQENNKDIGHFVR